MGSRRVDVVQDDRLSKTGSFRKANVSWNYGFKNAFPEILSRIVGDLPRKVEAGVVHREQDSVDSERLIDAVLNSMDSVQQLREAFEGVVLALKWNHQRVGCGEHIDGDQAERRRAVDEYEIVIISNFIQCSPDAILAIGAIDQLHFSGSEIRSCRKHVEPLELDVTLKGVANRRTPDQDLVKGNLAGVKLKSDTAGGIPLWVAVDEESALFCRRQTGGEIHGSRCFPNAALLVSYRDYTPQSNPRKRRGM